MLEPEPTGLRSPDASAWDAHPDGQAPPYSSTATRPDAAVARPDPSTPGPHAPERATNPDPLAQQRAAETAGLPPIPGYEVLRFVGHGGMGVVYEAVHVATRRPVALKLINLSGARDPIARERFDREVQALAALKHPNIVPVYDAGEWHGIPYCAMEFVPGGTLSQHLDRVRADPRGTVRLMAKVARAVAAMHAAGVLHRDLKPLNILLGAGDEPMVADFGLVRRADDDSDLTDTGLPVGTRVYMAPEQTLGRPTDYTPACDIWALGVTLYEVLTGCRPFIDDGGSGLSARIRSEQAPRVAALSPEVPAELAAVAHKCLEKRPGDRYPTAAAVADDLERWLRGDPVTAPPVPSPARAKRARRVRALVATIALVVLAAGIGTVRLWPPAEPVPPAAPVPMPAEPMRKTLAERVAAGEKVKLTDEKGIPTVPLGRVERYEIGEKAIDDYHGFFANSFGLAPLADEPWGGPIRVEADVGIYFSINGLPLGGVYVGRGVCPGTASAYESLVYCGAGPRFGTAKKERLLDCSNGQFWWASNTGGGGPMGLDSTTTRWSADDKSNDLRFAHLTIDVLADEVRTTGGGMPLRPVTQKWALNSLSQSLVLLTKVRHTLVPPAFGTGIGVFCRNSECVVANLTVSKLDP